MSNKHFDRKTQRILTMMIVALVGLLVYAAASDAGRETAPRDNGSPETLQHSMP